MRGIPLAASLVVVCLLAPVGASIEAVQGVSPRPGTALVPQLYCAIVYDAAGKQDCDVIGPLVGANEFRAVLAGGSGSVRVLIDDVSGPVTRQILYETCARSCMVRLPDVSVAHAAMYVYSTGAVGHSVAVEVSSNTEALV